MECFIPEKENLLASVYNCPTNWLLYPTNVSNSHDTMPVSCYARMQDHQSWNGRKKRLVTVSSAHDPVWTLGCLFVCRRVCCCLGILEHRVFAKTSRHPSPFTSPGLTWMSLQVWFPTRFLSYIISGMFFFVHCSHYHFNLTASSSLLCTLFYQADDHNLLKISTPVTANLHTYLPFSLQGAELLSFWQ